MGSRFRRARVGVAAEGGFSLVELLIAMFIMLIVVTSLTAVLVGASHTQLDADNRFQAQLADRTGLDKLRREIHCANAVTQTNGTPLVAGTAYSAITVTLGSTCPTATSGFPATYATWCTTSSPLVTGDFALYRVSSTSSPYPTCATAGKVKWIDYLQPTTPSPAVSTPFCLPSSGVACGSGASAVYAPTMSLPLLHVTLPVNLNGPTSAKDSYNLVDDIALRNGTRS